MATFLDVTGLEHFSSIFVFIFVWLVVYATLLWTKLLGDNKLIIALAGLLLGIFVIISPVATNVIANTAPFLAVIFVLILLINIAARMLGGRMEEGFSALGGVFMILIILIVIISAAIQVREQINIQETQKDFSKTINLIFHPTFLGTVLILAIAVFTIALLAAKST
jgi:hypothetical protein